MRVSSMNGSKRTSGDDDLYDWVDVDRSFIIQSNSEGVDSECVLAGAFASMFPRRVSEPCRWFSQPFHTD